VRAAGVLAVAVLALACSAVPVPKRAVYHPSDADLGITRVAHGSVILELRGTRVLVDPWFYSGLVVRQREPLGLTPEALPTLAAVLITHRHADHFDPKALADLAAKVPEAIARPELHGRLTALGFTRVTVLDWWERARVGDVEVTAVPTRHSVPENGYVLEAHGVRVYVAGDTRWFPELVDVATRFPKPDALLLPIGGTRVLGFLREMNPTDAARAAALFDPHRIVPIHYGEEGGFPLRWHTRNPVGSFLEACRKQGLDRSRVVVLEPGESWHYYR
jgi:L-ascorbate metabolism protein UlaG (beta-lactamase superfamily)